MTGTEGKVNFKLLLIIIYSLILVSCREAIEDQDPKNNFVDGKLPKLIDKLLNPEIPEKDKEKIAAKADANSSSFNLKVAVIDAGTEIYHPQLVDKLAWYKDSDGKLKLLGWDFVGNDQNPSPDAGMFELFAYGSEGIINGKISKPPENPLEILERHNNAFIIEFLHRLRNDKVLSSSIFGTKINSENLTIIGALQLVKYFDLNVYNTKKEENRLIKKEVLAFNNEQWAKLKSELNPFLDKIQDYYFSLYRPVWNMSLNHGIPYSSNELDIEFPEDSFLYNLENADLFINLLGQTLKSFSYSKDFDFALNNYKLFIYSRSEAGAKNDEELNKVILQRISRALNLRLYPNQENSLFFEIVNDVERRMVNEVAILNERIPLNYKIEKKDIASYFDRVQNMSKNYIDFINIEGKLNAEVTGPMLRAFSKIQSHINGIDSLNSITLKDHNLSEKVYQNLLNSLILHKNHLRTIGKNSNPIVDYLNSTRNSYLNPIFESHGTHTAGLIANNNPSVQVVPMRVLLFKNQSSKEVSEKIEIEFIQKFKKWLINPLVFLSLRNKFYGKETKESIDWNNYSLDNRLKVADALINIWKDSFHAITLGNSNEFIFINQMVETIKFCGKNKIKIASLSLGGESEKLNESLKDVEEHDDLEDSFGFIETEFEKWTYADAILKYAKSTLFVVALGNSSAWVDGVSRSATPIDLSSNFYVKLDNDASRFSKEELTYEVAPNNQINQILGVGSTDSKNAFSAFTNVIIRNKLTPQVFFIGENVNSSIRHWDKRGFSQLRSSYLNFIDKFINLNHSKTLLESYILKNEKLSRVWNSRNEKSKKDIRELLSSRINMFTEFLKPALLEKFLNSPTNYGRMNGTSMATPGVARQISIWVTEMAKSKNIQHNDDIYDDPEFSPEKLIQLVKDKSKLENEYYFLPKDPSWEVKPNEETKTVTEFFKKILEIPNPNVNKK